MAFEDLHGILDVVIFSSVYLRYKKELTTKRPYIVEGPLGFDEEKGEPYIRAERIISLD